MGGTRIGIYPGQYFDSETEFHYNRFRYFESKSGRYLTIDPIGLNSGFNLFGYSSFNPINWADPYGLKQCDIDAAIKVIKESRYNNELILPEDILVDIPMPPLINDKPHGTVNWGYRSWNSIHLNKYYLRPLNDAEAKDLLDTVIHESIHYNESIFKNIHDRFDEEHPDVYERAKLLTNELLAKYNIERRKMCEKTRCGSDVAFSSF